MNKVNIKYAVTYASQDVTQAEYDLVYALYNFVEPRKVTAIKFIRQQYGIGLREAKDVCDTIGASGPRREDY